MHSTSVTIVIVTIGTLALAHYLYSRQHQDRQQQQQMLEEGYEADRQLFVSFFWLELKASE